MVLHKMAISNFFFINKNFLRIDGFVPWHSFHCTVRLHFPMTPELGLNEKRSSEKQTNKRTESSVRWINSSWEWNSSPLSRNQNNKNWQRYKVRLPGYGCAHNGIYNISLARMWTIIWIRIYSYVQYCKSGSELAFWNEQNGICHP